MVSPASLNAGVNLSSVTDITILTGKHPEVFLPVKSEFLPVKPVNLCPFVGVDLNPVADLDGKAGGEIMASAEGELIMVVL